MKKTALVLTILSLHLLMSSYLAAEECQDELAVLSPDPDIPQSREMMRSHLRRLAHAALDSRLEKYESLRTEQQIMEYQQEMRGFFIKQLGGFPEKTPLKPKIIGGKKYEGFKVERIIFESAPGFYVTALLYLPLSEPPYPGVLLLCGHTSNGKAGYQEPGVLMARNGIACLCPDPIGQGERRQLLDDLGQPLFESTTTEHNIEGVAPILLGKNLASYMVWDGIRSIDYLVSRQDIDPARIGCTGNSGGGNMTSFLMALDERIVSAAPSCFISSTRRKNESPGPGDAEQNIHAQTAFGMDHADFIMMRAPRPTLVLSATRDYVPIAGAWDAFRQAKRLYTRLGHGERVSIIEADDEHGFSPQLREGSARWMRRWLLGIDDAVTGHKFPPLQDEDTQCTPRGQVLLMPGAKSIFDLNAEYEKELREQRRLLWNTSSPEKIRAEIRRASSIRGLADLPRPTAEKTGSLKRGGSNVEKLILTRDTDIKLPGLLFRPPVPNGSRVLYLDDKGKSSGAASGGEIDLLIQEGHTVLALDVRGIGETATTPWRYQGSIEWMGPSVAEFFIAYMLDKSFLAMRTEDILAAARYLSEAGGTGAPSRIQLIATGELSPPALHAASLEPELFSSVRLKNSLISWSEAVTTPITRNVLINAVHGALKTYDLPDLVSLYGKDKVVLENALDAEGNLLR